MMKRHIESENGIPAIVVWIAEETIVDPFFATTFGHVHTVRQDHVVKTLVCGASYFRMLADNIEILCERSDPVLTSELFAILVLGN
jgi:hypothetical protein